MKKNTEKNRIRKRILITGISLLIVVMAIAVISMNYFDALLDLIDRGEVPGDSSFYNETDPYNTSDPIINTSQTEINSTEGNTTTISTTTETTIDPRIIEIQEQQREALNIPLRSDSQVINILLIGSDRREGETTGRSDSMIIFSINKRTRKIHLVSLMRALYVKIPDHGFNLLNASYSYGGSKMLRQTIENNLRVKLSDYIMIDFAGFTAAIDLVGGLDINLTLQEAEYIIANYGFSVAEGMNHLDGTMSLAYARIRKIDSDFARTRRQRDVITLLIQKMMAMNPSDLDTTARSILPLVKTNMDDSKIISLAIGALEYKDYEIKQLMLPIKNSSEIMYVNRMEVVKFDFKDNIEALQEFIYDD